jgi:hypothetical protein
MVNKKSEHECMLATPFNPTNATIEWRQTIPVEYIALYLDEIDNNPSKINQQLGRIGDRLEESI